MTTFNTGNPIGSVDPRDLYDNAENLDTAVNTKTDTTWTDRLGVERKTFHGMEVQFDSQQGDFEDRFQETLSKIGYEQLGDYAAGLEITEYNQIFRHEGEWWRASASLELPYTTTGDWGAEEGLFVGIGEALLRQELAQPDGSGMVGYSYAVDYGAGTVGSELKILSSKQELLIDSTGINIEYYASLSDGGERWDLAIQAAVDYVIQLAESTGSTSGLPRIIISAGRYKCMGEIVTAPFVKIQPVGSVVLDFSQSPVETNGVWVRNYADVIFSIESPNNNLSPCLGGDQGSIAIVGQGRDGVSLADGLRIGNEVAGMKPCRDALIKNVMVLGWNAGVRFYTYDTYLATFEGCLITTNNTNVAFPAGEPVNSGERITFTGCTLSASEYAISHAGRRWDVYWFDCSFDFNGSILRLWDTALWAEHKFIGCYFEAWDGYVVDGAAAGDQCHIVFDAPTFMPTRWKDQSVVASSSRRLFNVNDRTEISVKSPKRIILTRPYLEDSYVINSSESLLEWQGESRNAYPTVPFSSRILNSDYDFQFDPLGTVHTGLTYWERLTGSTDILSTAISDIGGKKCLSIQGGSTSSAVTIRGKDRIPCLPGDRFILNAALRANNVEGSINVIMRIEFFDSDNNSLGIYPPFATYSFKDALLDSTLPNYGEGGNRFMDTSSFATIAPNRASYGLARLTLNSFQGTVNISRARVFRDL